MDKIKHRAVTEFFVMKGLLPMKIHNEVVNVLEDAKHSKPMVSKWELELKPGCMNNEDYLPKLTAYDITEVYWDPTGVCLS